MKACQHPAKRDRIHEFFDVDPGDFMYVNGHYRNELFRNPIIEYVPEDDYSLRSAEFRLQHVRIRYSFDGDSHRMSGLILVHRRNSCWTGRIGAFSWEGSTAELKETWTISEKQPIYINS